MKKQISTKAVTKTILDSAKSKLNTAISLTEGVPNLIAAWEWMQRAKQDLSLLEVIFYYEQEYAIEDTIKSIRKKLENTIIIGEVSQTSKECYAEIVELENYIAKELEQAE